MSSTDKSSGRGDWSWRLLAPASRSGMFLTLGAAAPNSPRSSQPHRVGLPPVARRSAGLPRVNRPDAVTAFTWLGCWRLERAAGCKNALRTRQGQRGPFPQTAAQLEQAANGVEVVELGIAIRLALTLEGLEYRADSRHRVKREADPLGPDDCFNRGNQPSGKAASITDEILLADRTHYAGHWSAVIRR